MSEKFLKARFQHKGKTEAEWYLDVYDESGNIRENPFIPLKDEIIIFEKDDAGNNENRIKVGDGETNVMELPFAGAKYSINNKNGKTSLINDGNGTEQEILPFFLNEAGNRVILTNKSFGVYAGEYSEPVFQSKPGKINIGGPESFMSGERLLYSDFEVGRTYWYTDFDYQQFLIGQVVYNGQDLIFTGPTRHHFADETGVVFISTDQLRIRIYSQRPDLPALGLVDLCDDQEYTVAVVRDIIDGSFSRVITANEFYRAYEDIQNDISNASNLNINSYSLLTYDKTYKTFGTKYLQDKKVAENSFSIFDGQIGGSGAIYSISAGTSNKNALGSLKDIIGNYVSANPPKAYGSISFAGGLDSSAWSVSTVAHGIRAMAGIRGYKWTSVTETTITLNGVPSDWKEDDWICIVNSSKYPFCAQIQSVSGQVVTVKGKLPFTGSNYSVLDLLSLNPDDMTVYAVERKANGSEESPYYTITPRGGNIELAWGAMALGADTLTSGTLSFNFGVNNVQAGDYGATFGRSNLGGYGNLVSGAWNTSTGQHSGVFGRNLVNYGDYNILGGRKNTINNVPGIDPSSQNSIGGYNNVLTGHRNMLSGKDNSFSICYNNIGSGESNSFTNCSNNIGSGLSHVINNSANSLIFGKQVKANNILKCIVGGYGHLINQTAGSTEETIIVGGEHTVSNAHDSAIFGYKNTASHKQTFLFGTGLHSNAEQQVVVGRYNNTSDAAFVVGGGDKATNPQDLFIVQRDGRATVNSTPRDSMDVATKGYVDSHTGGVDEGQVREIVENVLLNGEW